MKLDEPGFDEGIYGQWERHWQREDTRKLTPVGKLITRSKQRALAEVIQKLDCDSVMEVGCGMGFTFEVISAFKPQATGIDVSDSAVATCRNKGLNVRKAKLEEIAEKYDLVVSDGLLEHFLDFEPYALQMARISSKYVILIQTDHASLLTRLMLFLEGVFRQGKNVPERDYRIGDFVGALRKGGFELVADHPLFLGSFRLLVFERKDN
ncbi:MAG: methyltransferase domain-containing protein [Chloroflexi bacterium]|nr:methyltransferase domain-containing protein [Chloroflexota bacterium]